MRLVQCITKSIIYIPADKTMPNADYSSLKPVSSHFYFTDKKKFFFSNYTVLYLLKLLWRCRIANITYLICFSDSRLRSTGGREFSLQKIL